MTNKKYIYGNMNCFFHERSRLNVMDELGEGGFINKCIYFGCHQERKKENTQWKFYKYAANKIYVKLFFVYHVNQT